MEINPMQEIREIRRQISQECENDPEKVFAYYQERQNQLKAAGNYTFVTGPLSDVPVRLTAEPELH